MTASHVQTTAARKAASLQQATLDALASVVSDFVKQHLDEMGARLATALADVSEPGLDTREVYRRVKSSRLLKENGYAFTHLAEAAIKAAVQQELDLLSPSAVKRAPIAALTLVPLEEIDDKLAFTALARPFDIQYADALATLSVRLGLLLERGLLRADGIPFRPAVFLTAFDHAWREFEPDPDAHGMIQPFLRPDIVFDFTPLYDNLIEALKRKAGQPGSVDALRIQKTDDVAAAKAARATSRAALAKQLRAMFGDDGGDDGVPLIPDLPGMPSGSGGWRPSAAAGFDVAASAAASGAPVPAGAGNTAGASTQPAAGFTAPGGSHGAGGHAAGGVVPAQGFAPGAQFQGQGQGQALQWAGIPVQGLVAAATGAAPMVMPVGMIASAPLLDLLARMEPVLAAGAAPSGPVFQEGAGAQVPPDVFYLPRLQQSLPRGSLSRGDERTLDLLARVFETVLLDDSIPPRARELLQVLQVPVLKAALQDKQFFFEEAHPARRMVDLLSRMGWEQHKDNDDPVFQAMQRSVEQVAGGEPAGFENAVASLEASLAKEESAEEQALAAPVASALKQEKMLVATRAARDAVSLRVGANEGELIEVVSGFLEQHWTTVMTFAYSIEQDKPGAVGNATRVMDELIWSVKPKATQEQRKALIAKLPRLLTTINKWLDAIRWQDSERLQFFAHLAEYHASIVRAPIELSPERQMELAVEAAQRDAVRRVELEEAAASLATTRSETLSPVDGLERGMWCEFRSNGNKRKVRLAWVSPLRTLFIFSGAGQREAFSMTAEKLADALHAGTARVLAIDGVVGQVLMAALSTNPNEGAGGPGPTLH